MAKVDAKGPCTPATFGNRTSREISILIKAFPVRKNPDEYLILGWELRKEAERLEMLARNQRRKTA